MGIRRHGGHRTLIGLLAAATLAGGWLGLAPAAQAVRPGEGGRTVYLKADHAGLDIVIYDGRYNHFITNDGGWLDRATWCGDNIVGAQKGVGLVMLPVDHDSNVGTPFVVYPDPNNLAVDPACNANGSQIVFAQGSRLLRLPAHGSTGPVPIAQTASGGAAFEPTWSSDDNNVAFEEAVSTTFSAIEVASAYGKFISGGIPVTPNSPGLRHGPSWRSDRILYWQEDPTKAGHSLGIFFVHNGDLSEVGPIDGSGGSIACKDPTAFPEDHGFECVGSDNYIKAFPGPTTLINSDAIKPDIERLGHHENHFSQDRDQDYPNHWKHEHNHHKKH